MTQRQLILIRHAKAVEDEVGGDHGRPLSVRGLEDAAALGEWLLAQGIHPEMVMCSTAIRTRQTLEAFGQNWPTVLRDKIYLASASDMLAQIQNGDDAVTTLMMIGHNPGMHGLLGLLTGSYAQERDAEKMIMKFPTAACAILSFELDHWKQLAAQNGRLEQIRWPVDA